MTGDWFVKGMCHGQFWGEPCLSEQGIDSCEVILEVSGYMYPGSGLQTGTGGSDFGSKLNWEIFLNRDRGQIKGIFIVFYHGTI